MDPIQQIYNWGKWSSYLETMLSPAPAMVEIAMNWAAVPLDAASAPTPPSNAAIRFSKTSYAYE